MEFELKVMHIETLLWVSLLLLLLGLIVGAVLSHIQVTKVLKEVHEYRKENYHELVMQHLRKAQIKRDRHSHYKAMAKDRPVRDPLPPIYRNRKEHP